MLHLLTYAKRRQRFFHSAAEFNLVRIILRSRTIAKYAVEILDISSYKCYTFKIVYHIFR